MFRRIAFFLLFLALGINSYSQVAEVVKTEGRVLCKDFADVKFIPAEPGLKLSSQAEIKTGKAANCTIKLNTGNNFVFIGQQSFVKIKNLIPGAIELKKGRVLSLIEDLPKGSSYTIETPVAIAGVRGTGFGMEYLSGQVFAFCFEDAIFVKGKSGQEKDVPAGFGINIGPEGTLGSLFPLGPSQLHLWENFLGSISGNGNENEDFRQDNRDRMDDIGQERKQTFRDTEEGFRLDKRSSGQDNGKEDYIDGEY